MRGRAAGGLGRAQRPRASCTGAAGAVFLGTTVLGLSIAGTARAGEGDKGAAQVLFDQGQALVKDKRFAEACPKFEESLRLEPGTGTMLWLADCYENNGKTASAWAEFKDAAAAAALRHDPREAIAHRRAEDLEPRLARLQIVAPPGASVPGLEVRRDGIVIGNAELGLAVPVNPGAHGVSVSARGRKPWSTSVTAAERGTATVTIPVLESAPESAVTASEGTTGSAESPATAPGTETGGERKVWGMRQTAGVAAAGAGVVAIGIGSFFGLEAKSTYDSWTSQCAGSTSSTCAEQRSSASSQATTSDILFGLGGAAVVAGAVLFFVPTRVKATTAFAPIVSPHVAGVALSTAF